MYQPEIFVAYNKAVKVIFSCNTVGHLHSAIQYVKNLEKQLPQSYLWVTKNLNKHIQFKLNMLRER
jgi:hypothetical protein